MKRRTLILMAVAWLAAGSSIWADTVKTDNATIIGKVTGMSATQVTVEQTNGTTKTIPVNEIQVIHYEGESALLKTVRTAIAAGRYEEAIQALDRIKLPDAVRPEITQDLEFYRALATAKLALAGSREILAAGKAMVAFVTQNPNSYHYLAACEIIGDLLVANQRPDLAQPYYAELSKAPWPDYQMRGGVVVGRALLAEGKYEEAAKAFQKVLDTKASGDTAENQRSAAALGKARCLTESSKTDEAIALVQGVIDKANPEAVKLNAEAYNTLGLALRKAERPKEAVMAFLHTDVLYFASPEDHVTALRNLVDLWKELQRPDRAAQAQEVLAQQYHRAGTRN